VTLDAGEAAFEVAHDAGRPFRVLAGSARILATGTQFDVLRSDSATLVTVIEGRVAVGLSGDLHRRGAPGDPDRSARIVELIAGQQISVAEGSWPGVPAIIDVRQGTAWMHRQISFEHEPLERVASELNRYAAKPIEIATPALRTLEISGVFVTDDTEAFVAFLRTLEGVHVEVTPTHIRVSRD
jgi:transmembrane sensor